MLTKTQRLIALFVSFVFFAALYWGLGNTPYTVLIAKIYFFLCLILSVAYVLINGGITPILDQDREKEERVRKKYLADKGKLHPIKRREKYRRFHIKNEEDEPTPEPVIRENPNPLKIPDSIRRPLVQILLVLVIPLYVIFMIDYFVLFFFS